VQQAVGIDGGVGAMTLLAGSTANEQQDRSRVVCLLNMVTHDELLDNDEYEGMLLLSQTIHNDVDSFL
jgi:splicing factor U2AF subunit